MSLKQLANSLMCSNCNHAIEACNCDGRQKPVLFALYIEKKYHNEFYKKSDNVCYERFLDTSKSLKKGVS